MTTSGLAIVVADVASLENYQVDWDNLTSDCKDHVTALAETGYDVGDGLTLSDEVLSLGPLTKSSTGASVETHGSAIYSLEGEGWSEQVSTTGKNLWDGTYYSSHVSFDGKTYSNLITDTRTKFLAQIQLINSTTYVDTLVNYSVATTGLHLITFDIPSATFTHALFKHGGLTADINIDNYFFTSDDVQVGETYTISFDVVSNDPTTVGGLKLSNIQLEAGSTATTYEPYSAGAPSPSPDYPQEIEVCRGRNLLDESALVSPGGIDSATGEDATATTYMRSSFIAVEQAAHYLTFTREATSSNVGCNAYWYDSSKVFISVQTLISGSKVAGDYSVAVTPPSGAAFVRITLSLTATNIQLELGSTPTPYVPYGHVGLEVQGRNLIDGDGLVNSSAWKQLYYQLEPNTEYVISTNRPSSSDALFNLLAQGTTGTGVKYPSNGNPVTFTTDATALIRIDYRNSGSDLITNYWYQLELGSTAHEYQPYRHTTTPIPLPSKGWAGAVGNYSDKLTVDSAGRWEWECKTAKESCADATGWSVNGSLTADSTPATLFIRSFTGKRPGADTNINGEALCSTLIGSVTGAIHLYTFSQRTANGNIEIVLKTSDASDTTELGTFLAAHPMTFLYPLATPTTEHGYIDLPALPEGATVSCPELDEIGVSWVVPGAAELMQHISNVYKRVESIVAELATS